MALQDTIANNEADKESTGGAVVAKATKTKGKKRTAKKRTGRKKAAVKKAASQRKTTTASAPRKSARHRRYTPQERQHILDVAKREGLTGAKVAERFGVSTLSYYTWRKKAGKATTARRGRPPGRRSTANGSDLESMLRGQVREQIHRMLPDIIAAEIAGYFR